MDISHVVIGLSGGLVAWWLSGSREPPRPEQPACHCVCSVVPEQSNRADGWILAYLIGGLVLVILVVVILGVALRIIVKRLDIGDRDYSVSRKGKSGKGVYGGTRGLQILDR